MTQTAIIHIDEEKKNYIFIKKNEDKTVRMTFNLKKDQKTTMQINTDLSQEALNTLIQTLIKMKEYVP
jgi:hypothetical protein